METKIKIIGTHCRSCKSLIEDVASDVKGVISCTVDFVTGETALVHDDTFDLGTFAREIERLGEYKIETI